MTADDHMAMKTAPFAAITHAIARLAGAQSADEIVEVIRTTARTLVGSEGVSIIRREGEYCHYIEEDAIGPLWKGEKFPASVCVSGWAMIEKRTVIVPDIAMEPRISREFYDRTFVKSIVMVPVRVADPIGAIGVYWSRPYTPGAAEIEILEALASAAATSMENVRLITALSDALKTAELARDELKHRVKNAYMGVQSLARLSLDPKQARSLIDRIGALARAHAFLDDRMAGLQRIGLRELVEIEIEPYTAENPGRIRLNGPPVEVTKSQAIPLGLAINELATNALKHGALSVAEGVVDISWSRENGVFLDWSESNGPDIKSEGAGGEGSGLLRRLVEDQLKGRLEHTLKPSGAHCVIAFALETVASEQPSSVKA